MPAWILTALPYIVQAPSVIAGVLHLMQAAQSEIASGDDPLTKGAKIAQDLATNAPAIEQALLANTPAAHA